MLRLLLLLLAVLALASGADAQLLTTGVGSSGGTPPTGAILVQTGSVLLAGVGVKLLIGP